MLKYLSILGLIVGLSLALSLFDSSDQNQAHSKDSETRSDKKVIDLFSQRTNFQPDGLGILDSKWDDTLALDKESDGDFENKKVYISNPIKGDFKFNAYTICWKADLPSGTEIIVEARTSQDGEEWATWDRFRSPGTEMDDGGREDGVGVVEGKKGAYTYGDLFFPDDNLGETYFIQFRATLQSEDPENSPVLDEIVIEYIDSLEGEKTDIPKAKAASNIPNIISRAGWGANESWMNWTPEYVHPENFYIHHTVTMNNDPNPPATVRAIYYYHAAVRGWGDIGYNFLIDQYGNIYEGRYGGNGVVGGHVLGYNYGSIGISLLGDFHPGSEARGNRSSYLTTAAKSNLEDLMAYRGYTNGINPLGTWNAGGSYPGIKNNISGHRDSGATACPGDYFYVVLPQIRQNTYNKYIELRVYRLVKEVGGDKVYLLVEGEDTLRWISSVEVFDAWRFRWNEIETVDLSGYNQGPSLYDLAQGSEGKVYWIDSGVKHWVPNPGIFNDWGFDWSKISTLPDLMLEKRPTSSKLTNLITDSGPKVYLLHKGGKSWIKDPIAFSEWGFNWHDIIKISDTRSSQVPTTGFLIEYLIKLDSEASPTYLVSQKNYYEIPNESVLNAWGFDPNSASVLSSSLVNQYLGLGEKELSNLAVNKGRVYLIDRTFRRHIPNPVVFDEWGFQYEDIIPVSKSLLLGLFPSSAKSLTVLAKIPEGEKVYLIDDGKKYWIISPDEFARRGFKWENIRTVSADLLDTLETKVATSFLVKKDSDPSKVYFQDELGLHHIPDPTIFDAWGFSWDDIVTINDGVFEGIPQSFKLHLLVTNQGGDKVYFVNSGKIHHIPDPTIFDAWDFSWAKISLVTTEFLNNNFQADNNLSVLLNPSDSKLYLLSDGKMKYISSDMFSAWGFSWDEITVIPLSVKEFLGFSAGDPVTRLAHKNGVVYSFDKGIKHKIPNPQTFGVWSFDWSKITYGADRIVGQKTQGEDVPYITNKASLKSSGTTNLRSNTGTLLTQTSSGKLIHIARHNSGYVVSAYPDFFRFASYHFRVDSSTGIVEISSYSDIPSWKPSLNDNKFRGTVEVRYSSTSNKLWVINELPIKSYLKGIAEASTSAPFEHIKTLTVAARSYAYYHLTHGGKHSGESFHLKNSRHGNGDDQVYKGYGLEARWPDLATAVSQTSGQVVTYGGTPVITPYFSRSDGRTRSWSEVWGGSVAWCISVPDPDCSGMSKLGHGVGLSSYGALKRAERGNSYQQILSYYYTGTGIGNVSNPNIRIAIYAI